VGPHNSARRTKEVNPKTISDRWVCRDACSSRRNAKLGDKRGDGRQSRDEHSVVGKSAATVVPDKYAADHSADAAV